MWTSDLVASTRMERTTPDSDVLEGDRALARRIASRDEAAFELFLNRFTSHVFRVAGRFFRRGDVVEDIAQEVFLKAYVSIATYRGETPLEHWISRVTVNACYDRLRKKKTQPEIREADLLEEGERFEEKLFSKEQDQGFWEKEDARLMAEKLLSALGASERVVLTLMILEEMPVAEVARITGWSIPNVKVRAFRARRRLRKLFLAQNV